MYNAGAENGPFHQGNFLQGLNCLMRVTTQAKRYYSHSGYLPIWLDYRYAQKEDQLSTGTTPCLNLPCASSCGLIDQLREGSASLCMNSSAIEGRANP
jgi:hypothetical protein